MLLIWALSFVNKADWLQISVFVISCYCILGYGVLALGLLIFWHTKLFTDKWSYSPLFIIFIIIFI